MTKYGHRMRAGPMPIEMSLRSVHAIVTSVAQEMEGGDVRFAGVGAALLARLRGHDELAHFRSAAKVNSSPLGEALADLQQLALVLRSFAIPADDDRPAKVALGGMLRRGCELVQAIALLLADNQVAPAWANARTLLELAGWAHYISRGEVLVANAEPEDWAAKPLEERQDALARRYLAAGEERDDKAVISLRYWMRDKGLPALPGHIYRDAQSRATAAKRILGKDHDRKGKEKVRHWTNVSGRKLLNPTNEDLLTFLEDTKGYELFIDDERVLEHRHARLRWVLGNAAIHRGELSSPRIRTPFALEASLPVLVNGLFEDIEWLTVLALEAPNSAWSVTAAAVQDVHDRLAKMILVRAKGHEAFLQQRTAHK